MVGGGGLIQLPVLFSFFPKEVPATLLGTSKLAGIFGTGAAAVNYARRVRVAWSAAAPAALAAFALSFAGAYTVTKVPADFVRALLPFVLVAVAVYTFRRRTSVRSTRRSTAAMPSVWWRSGWARASVFTMASSARAPAAS